MDSVIYTNKHGFDELAARFTISPAYGPAIANFNNYGDQDITAGSFYVKIPENWMKPEFQNKTIDLRGENKNAQSWMLYAGIALLAVALMGKP